MGLDITTSFPDLSTSPKTWSYRKAQGECAVPIVLQWHADVRVEHDELQLDVVRPVGMMRPGNAFYITNVVAGYSAVQHKSGNVCLRSGIASSVNKVPFAFRKVRFHEGHVLRDMKEPQTPACKGHLP